MKYWNDGIELMDISLFSNNFFLLRHGQSLANEQGLIVSNPAIGIEDYGLSATGKEQVQSTMEAVRERQLLIQPVLIYSSPFLRAKETAEIASRSLKCPVLCDERLRERFFGEFDLTDNSNYQRVWEEDRQDPAHKKWNVESVLEVLERTTSLVEELEQTHTGKSILLVTHGDPGQILETAFQHKNPKEHRQLKPLQTAELRAICNLAKV